MQGCGSESRRTDIAGQCRSRNRAALGLPVVVRGSMNRAAAGATCELGVRRDMLVEKSDVAD